MIATNTHIHTNVDANLPSLSLGYIHTYRVAGNSSQRLTLPHTITEWVGKAVCVHPEKGVGLSEKASITTFTPFFIDLTLPPSVQRGEILPVKISVFNYLGGALPVSVCVCVWFLHFSHSLSQDLRSLLLFLLVIITILPPPPPLPP